MATCSAQYAVHFWYSDEGLVNKCDPLVKSLLEHKMVEAHNHYAELFDYEKWNAEFKPIGAKYEGTDEWEPVYFAFIKQKQLEVIDADNYESGLLTFTIDDENQLVGVIDKLFAFLIRMPELAGVRMRIYLKKVD